MYHVSRSRANANSEGLHDIRDIQTYIQVDMCDSVSLLIYAKFYKWAQKFMPISLYVATEEKYTHQNKESVDNKVIIYLQH